MSRNDHSDAARKALDRFDVPPMGSGFTDRVLAAAAASGAALSPRVVTRRDRRGVWRRVGQGAIGVAALGMMSAAAVASGLLGAVGIEVPVLSAMLAPEPVRIKQAPAKKPVVRMAAKPATPPSVETPPKPPLPVPAADPSVPPWQQAMLARRAANEARRNAFVDSHPGLREAIAAGPDARRAYMAEHPDVRAQVRARFAEAKARRAAMRTANLERRRARLGDAAAGPALAPIDPGLRAVMAERRQARQAAFRSLDPETRATRIEAFRVRREARRARRAARDASLSIPDEGSADFAR